MEKFVRQNVAHLEFRFNSSFKELVFSPEGGAVNGVVLQGPTEEGHPVVVLHADAVVVACGGFAASAAALDRHNPGASRLFATSNVAQATGDWLQAVVESSGAATCDLNLVQYHPTGFVDPKHPSKRHSILCPEEWRGAGAVLVDVDTGRRFVDELGRRDEVADAINALPRHEALLLVPPQAEATLRATHVGFYENKGLVRLIEVSSADDLADALEEEEGLPAAEFAEELAAYDRLVEAYHTDIIQAGGVKCPATGKKTFPAKLSPAAAAAASDATAPSGLHRYWVARVRPVAHYCMGGLKIDTDAQVLREEDEAPIPGLFAAGEVTGGIHGTNRLGGNSLLDCVVFGSVAGRGAAQWASSAAQQKGALEKRAGRSEGAGAEL
jgi:succinate dehydrogenase/fumarate reductase flavoprotein subunit